MKRTRKTSGGEGWSLTSDAAPPPAPDAARSGPPLARLRLEQRRGKPVTVAAVEGLDAAATRALAKELKVRCGTGGTVKEGAVELQGDHRDTLREWLPRRGLRVKG